MATVEDARTRVLRDELFDFKKLAGSTVIAGDHRSMEAPRAIVAAASFDCVTLSVGLDSRVLEIVLQRVRFAGQFERINAIKLSADREDR